LKPEKLRLALALLVLAVAAGLLISLTIKPDNLFTLQAGL
jgi:hypothetical protein